MNTASADVGPVVAGVGGGASLSVSGSEPVWIDSDLLSVETVVVDDIAKCFSSAADRETMPIGISADEVAHTGGPRRNRFDDGSAGRLVLGAQHVGVFDVQHLDRTTRDRAERSIAGLPDQPQPESLLVESRFETQAVLGEQLLAFVLGDACQDATNVSDWHINRSQQRDHSSNTGLAVAVAPVARFRTSLRFQQLRSVVAPELRDAQPHHRSFDR